MLWYSSGRLKLYTAVAYPPASRAGAEGEGEMMLKVIAAVVAFAFLSSAALAQNCRDLPPGPQRSACASIVGSRTDRRFAWPDLPPIRAAQKGRLRAVFFVLPSNLDRLG